MYNIHERTREFPVIKALRRLKHPGVNKPKANDAELLLSKGAKVSLSRLKFLAMREAYLRP